MRPDELNLKDLRPKSFERLMPGVFKAVSSEPGGGNPFAQDDLIEMRVTGDENRHRPGWAATYCVRYAHAAYIIRPYHISEMELRRHVTLAEFQQYQLPMLEQRMVHIQPGGAWIRVAVFSDRTHPRRPDIHFDLFIYMQEGYFTAEPAEGVINEENISQGAPGDGQDG